MVRIYLFAGCPKDGCPEQYKKTYWYHKICGGKTMVDTSPSYGADLVCDKCSIKGDFYEWLFDCGNHGHYKATTYGAIFAISGLCQTADGSLYASEIMACINKLSARGVWNFIWWKKE